MQHVVIWFMNVEWVIVWCNLIDTDHRHGNGMANV